MKKKSMKSEGCCCPEDAGSYHRGKSLINIALGLLLISFGFGYITLQMLGLVAGTIYCLKGVVQMVARNC